MNKIEHIFLSVTGYLLVFLATWISRRNKSNRLFDTKGIPARHASWLLGLHLIGIACFGVLPLVMLGQPFTMITGTKLPSILWIEIITALSGVIIITGATASRCTQAGFKTGYTAGTAFLFGYFPVRFLFICAYEYFFRGLLFLDAGAGIGFLRAGLISTLMTVLIHAFTNRKEMVGCIPFGILLCCCCYALNAVWPAIILHLALCLSYELPPAFPFLKSVVK